MPEELTITNQKLLDLYKLPYVTNDNNFIRLAVTQEIELRNTKKIAEYILLTK